ncbi:hypothetical protein [Roseomonas indoligenes]|uniref:Uncharacterized protein n=1 Tax=Roseomonas indoligenes TaxID=2820811 RepID=A0A940S6H2_9PROT|nr:hypothetical protein [Pararoseomonas indoligenes]MBP0493945.1 hypothetical protein [Pararoseomonas indoligenes]
MINLRTIALAAALIGSLAAPAFADQERVPAGATASSAWTQSGNRTPLAGGSGQTMLEMSGATGGGGQHS